LQDIIFNMHRIQIRLGRTAVSFLQNHYITNMMMLEMLLAFSETMIIS
jgi:hypothetical protein